MDLQLGLAVVSRNSATKGFDLNFSEVDEFNNNVKKRGFYEEEEEEEENMNDVVCRDHPRMPVQTLPLLLWNYQKEEQHQEEEEEEERDDTVYEDNLDSSSSTVITDGDNHKIEGGTDGLIGWPPINPLRKRICHRNIGGYCVNVENGGIAAAAAASARKSSMYVKVKMKGVGIARKVDLTPHHSPQSLLQTLLTMFGKCQESIHSYVLSFQDQEGDWQLADQVPWRVLIGSVQRLKLHRKTTD